ncbi:TolC family outer membrane protein [soil metagenome]
MAEPVHRSSLFTASRRFALLLTLALGTSFAGTAHAQGLLQTYRDALTNDPTYAAARALHMANIERIPEARGGLLPSANLVGNLDYAVVEPSSLGGRQIKGMSRDYTLQLSQPLFRYANLQTYEQSKLFVLASEVQVAAARQDLIIRTAQAYFDVLGASDTLQFVRAQKAAISEQLASAKRNFEVGTTTITDSNEAQARYDLALSQEIAAENDLAVRRTALQQIIGRAPGELATLRPNTTLPPPEPAVIDRWVADSEAGNTNVRIAQANYEIAGREIQVAKAGHMPTVDLVGSTGYSRQPSIDGFTGVGTSASQRQSVIGVQVNIPMFAGFATPAGVRETYSLQEQSRLQVEAARRAAAQLARQTYLGVTSGLAQVRALEAAEVSNQSALDSNLLGYKVGLRVNIDVLNAQQQLFQARRDLAQARYNTLMSGLRLKQASGQLDEPDLLQLDALLAR